MFDATGGDTVQGSAAEEATVVDNVSQLPGPTSNPDSSASEITGREQPRRPPAKLRKSHNLIVSPGDKEISGGFLFLCVNRNSLVRQLGQIKLVNNSSDVHHVTDEALCEMLRREYRRLRGWRYWISLQSIYYFRFVKVRHFVTHSPNYQLTAFAVCSVCALTRRSKLQGGIAAPGTANPLPHH